MVFDEWQNGVPVALVITARQRQSDLAPWMHKVKAKMLAAKAEWHPNAFVLNDTDNEINSLKFESRTPPPLWLPNPTQTSSKAETPSSGVRPLPREQDPFLGSETPSSRPRTRPRGRDPFVGT
jgi:hypothetical protein